MLLYKVVSTDLKFDMNTSYLNIDPKRGSLLL